MGGIVRRGQHWEKSCVFRGGEHLQTSIEGFSWKWESRDGVRGRGERVSSSLTLLKYERTSGVKGGGKNLRAVHYATTGLRGVAASVWG